MTMCINELLYPYEGTSDSSNSISLSILSLEDFLGWLSGPQRQFYSLESSRPNFEVLFDRGDCPEGFEIGIDSRSLATIFIVNKLSRDHQKNITKMNGICVWQDIVSPNFHKICVLLMYTFWFIDMPDMNACYGSSLDSIEFFVL